jgi:hypothetical protein
MAAQEMNHEGHKEHKANSLQKGFFVTFVLFLVPDFFSRSEALRYKAQHLQSASLVGGQWVV